METSKNERAKEIMWMRDLKWVTPIDQPCELGFQCPVCEYPHDVDGNYDERLQWSEYNGFIWCSVCNFDIPSVLCIPITKNNIEKTTSMFLDCVENNK
jgi:hypothetical protein